MKKTTISIGGKFHLFERLMDRDKNNVYIELEDITECCFELWEVNSGDTSSRARIKIPKKVWAKMIEDWTNYKRKDDKSS
jgi:hypothetical protein